jgi:uncharacterized protein (DUF924 family)
MSIPPPDPASPAGALPTGEHPATWDEVVARFGTNPHRLQLLAGLE